jgi:CBS domain-containing protein
MTGVLLVRDFMSRDVKTVRTDATVKEAVGKMNKFRIGSIIVMEGKRPVGIITERDILERIVEPCMEPTAIKAKEIMSSPVISTSPEVNIEDVARLMASKKIKKLAVIENGKMVGIITSMDLMKASPKLINLMEEFRRTKQ